MIKVKKMVQTCFVCPSQWEGVDFDDRPIYIRERHGILRVDYGEKGQEFPYPTIFGPVPCEELAILETIKEKTKDILDWTHAEVKEIPISEAEPDENYWDWLKK